MPRLFKMLVLVLFLFGESISSIAWSQEILVRKQPINALVQAQTIALHVQVAKEGKQIASHPLTKLITQRFRQVGYDVVTDSKVPHDDVSVFFLCKEPTTSKPTTDSNEKGVFQLSTPPCLFHYAFHETPVDWQRIDLIVFNEGIQAVESLNQISPRPGSIIHIAPISLQYLDLLDFPILLAAEWGQVSRLLSLLKNPNTSLARQKKIILLLGEIQAEQAFLLLLNLLNSSPLREEAARALGNFGSIAQKPLISILKTHPSIQMQAAAAQSLGQIGAATGDTSLTPLYLELLEKQDLDIRVKTEIVWAIGKSPDFGAHSALETLENQIWNIRSTEPRLQKLREAVDWSIREVRQGGHTGAYD